MQHFLKAASGVTRAKIVAAQFFQQVFIRAYNAKSPLDAGFGGVAPAALTAALERNEFLRTCR
jgi:hypothetical protein